MKAKPVITEVVLLLIMLSSMWLIGYWVTGSLLLNSKVDINLHDTYFVIPGSTLFVMPALIILVFIYSIRGLFYKYKNAPQNIILLAMLAVLNLLLINFIISIAYLSIPNIGWTIYPPLSALQNKPTQPSLFKEMTHFLFYIEIFFLMMLVIVAILTGRNWKTKQ